MATTKITKPGYKTTECGLPGACTVGGILYASGAVSVEGSDATSKAIALIASVLAAMGYSVSRAKVKADIK